MNGGSKMGAAFADLDQKLQRKMISKLYNSNPTDFLRRFLIVDEVWIYHYTPETKQQSRQWTEKDKSATKKANGAPSAGKVLATVFREFKRIILLDYLEKSRAINAEYYANFLDKLRSKIKEKGPGLATKKVPFHHNNVPFHKSSL
ncbi:hypothetical protein HNY73_015343 [Argiope bruennichi]|uniref:Transposase n=1 Tax=Argiope bruennichi TaxID=94029 RepID=A0A8T0ES22_ARGBR|nr:hypothetical protein HNY73_015343 [Argiope bruennichi]